MTSPFLERPLRTLAQARAEIAAREQPEWLPAAELVYRSYDGPLPDRIRERVRRNELTAEEIFS